MDEKEIINRVRGLGFMAGVLEAQGLEPLCSRCISYAITVEESREALTSVKELVADNTLSEEMGSVLKRAEGSIMSLTVPSDPERQRKIGRCNFPDKACFVKKTRKTFLYFKEKESR